MAKKELTVVNTRQCEYADENGNWSQRPTKLYLDKTGDVSFVYEVPKWISDALGVSAQVRKPTADAARGEYVQLIRRYVEHMKNAKAEPILLVDFGYYAKDEEGRRLKSNDPHFHASDSDEHRTLMLSYSHAFRVNGAIYSATEKEIECQENEPGAKQRWPFTEAPTWTRYEKRPGHRINYPNGVPLDYTPELHAQLDAMMAGIDKAAQFLAKLDKAGAGAAALLATWAATQPLLGMKPTPTTA